jgi:hypothetical protein
MDQKGILSADLIFATLLLLMVIASALSIISTGMDSAENTEFSKAKVLADSVARTINTAYTNGDGNYIIFNFDNSSSDFNYLVYVTNTGVNVEYKSKNASSSIIPSNYLSSNSTVIHPGESYNVSNSGGFILLTKIT